MAIFKNVSGGSVGWANKPSDTVRWFGLVFEVLLPSGYRVFDTKAAQSAWKVFNLLEEQSSARIFNISEGNSSWKLYNLNQHPMGYTILRVDNFDSTYRVFNLSTRDISSKIFTLDSLDLSHKIFNDRGVDSSWKTFNLLGQHTSWRIFDTKDFDSSWMIPLFLRITSGYNMIGKQYPPITFLSYQRDEFETIVAYWNGFRLVACEDTFDIGAFIEDFEYDADSGLFLHTGFKKEY